MNRKIKITAIVLFTLMTVCANAQNGTLREGYYQTQGSPDHVYIGVNKADSGKGNTLETMLTEQRGSYGIIVWVGMPGPNNILWSGTGNIVRDEFRVNVVRRNSSNMATNGISLARGTLAILHVEDNETFYDEIGGRWIWRRR
jgi:hypothetical protein